MRGRRGSTRLLAAAILILPTLVLLPSASTAAPTKADVDAARRQLDTLHRDLSLLVEQYNQASLELDRTEADLARTREVQAAAQAQAQAAIRALSARASSAYMERGSQLDVLLGAGSFADFSDRLEFLNQLQRDDADLAATAEAASQRAQWAAQELAEVEARQSALVERLQDKRAAIEDRVEEQRALVEQLGEQYRAAVQRRQEAREAAAAEAAAAEAAQGAAASGTGGTGGWNPPPSGAGAQAAVSAAYSAIGSPYQWGGASPSGFDCSGLTMWAWAHGGVSLPHGSGAQFAATPRVDRTDLAPGDLLFFYNPISHVAIYVGGGSMIDASHPGASGAVQRRPVNWGSYVGAGRP
jgi:cell wall-associated NlpC family hydrolase